MLEITTASSEPHVHRKSSRTRIQIFKGLNKRIELKFRSKSFSLGRWIADVSLLVEFFHGRHKRFTTYMQVSGRAFLELDCCQRNGSPLVFGRPVSSVTTTFCASKQDSYSARVTIRSYSRVRFQVKINALPWFPLT